MGMPKISALPSRREAAILRALYNFTEESGTWARPQDIGGHHQSNHSRYLYRLYRKGYVERTPRVSLENVRRGVSARSAVSWLYRVSRQGLEYLGRQCEY